MTNYSLEVMDHIDPALVEEVELSESRKQRRPRFRAAVIAACVCLALVGTGAAAVANGWIKLSDITTRQINRRDGTTLSIATVKIVFDGKTYVPWERFSQQCQDFPSSFTGMPQYKGFASWDELEAFLGLNIMDNPVLDQAKPILHENRSSLGGRTETGSCFAGFYGKLDEPYHVDLSAAYLFETHDSIPLYVSLYTRIETEPRGEQTTGRIFEKTGEGMIALMTETYVTPSGLETILITSNIGDIEAYFQINGVVFNILSHCDNEHLEDGTRTVKEILDAFT